MSAPPIFSSAMSWVVERGWAQHEHPLLDGVMTWVLPLGGGDLEHRLRAAGQQTAGPYLLPATRADELPVLAGLWDFDDAEAPVVRLRVALFQPAPAGHDHPVVATGLRYESPEHLQEEHRFWHVQPIRALRAASDRTLPGLPTWFPDEEPTVAVNAFCADDLLACVLLALYGRATLDRRQRADLGDALGPSLSRLTR